MRAKLDAWGLTNAHLEPFQFGRGWELEKFSLELTAPRYFPMFGYPLAWTPSTKGVLAGAPIYLADKTEAEITALGEKLRGAIILASPPQTVFTLTDRLQPADTDQLVRIGGPEPPAERQATSVVPANAMATLLQKFGAGAILRPGTELHGTITVGGNPSDAQGFSADRDRDGRALQHDRAHDADRRDAATASGAAHGVSGERSQQLQRDRRHSRRGSGAARSGRDRRRASRFAAGRDRRHRQRRRRRGGGRGDAHPEGGRARIRAGRSASRSGAAKKSGSSAARPTCSSTWPMRRRATRWRSI